jgi:hypothetical protein
VESFPAAHLEVLSDVLCEVGVTEMA